MPLDNIPLNPGNRRTDQSLSNFQTGIGAVVHVTLDTEQLISHTQTALIDTIASLQGSDGGVIAAFLYKCSYFLSQAHRSDASENSLLE